METLTIAGAYFEQPQIIEELWRVLMGYPDELAEKIKLRLVDDHSKAGCRLVIPVDIRRRFDVQAFYVLDDIPWNEMGARNLAMKHAEGWCYMTDPDYILYPEDAAALFKPIQMVNGTKKWTGEIARGNYYHLNSKLHSDGRRLHRPENMAVLHREDFWRVKGYDEAFAGGYGFSDTLLFRALKEVGKFRNVFVNANMNHYPKGIIELPDGTRITDAASPAKRCTERNHPIYKRTNATIAHKGWPRFLRDRPAPIRFKWERFA